MKFTELKLNEKIQTALEKLKYENLTPIQEQIIPAVQEGMDVLGCSQTGSGKTAAFLIPILAKLVEDSTKNAIIITPTRELAMQIMTNVKDLCDERDLNRALIIGGASIRDQLLSIKKNPRIIIGTPGRLNDFLDSRKLNISKFNILVLDEMDRMLDMGFSVQIEGIIKLLEKNRQTLLFSATISKKIEKMTQKYLNNPLIAKVGESNQPSANVSQEIIKIKNEEKFDRMTSIMKTSSTFSLVFVKTKFGTEKIAQRLMDSGYEARAIHGDFKQAKRDRIIREYRSKKFNVLVATDVAARGLDIPHIDTVFNYDMPQCPEDYIHRIGRCSRGLDIKGTSISFCSREDESKLRAIRSLIKDSEYDEADVAIKRSGRSSGGSRDGGSGSRGGNSDRSRQGDRRSGGDSRRGDDFKRSGPGSSDSRRSRPMSDENRSYRKVETTEGESTGFDSSHSDRTPFVKRERTVGSFFEKRSGGDDRRKSKEGFQGYKNRRSDSRGDTRGTEEVRKPRTFKTNRSETTTGDSPERSERSSERRFDRPASRENRTEGGFDRKRSGFSNRTEGGRRNDRTRTGSSERKPATGSGYDIEGLAGERRPMSRKRAAPYMISSADSKERRRKIGL